MSFNYIDNIQSSTYSQFVADQHDHAIEQTGRKAYIFLLDKIETVLSDVYKEEKHGRVYLPHFVQRAYYKTNNFISQLNTSNYTEKEDNLEMEFDFGRMVHNIHELKSNSSGILTVTNNSKVPLDIEINKKFIIRKNKKEIYSHELNSTVYSFINEVNNETELVKLEYTGDSESLDFLERITVRLLPRRNIEINLNNSIYKNTSDVIDNGAIIVNDKMRVYQVVGAYPKNDIYTQYVGWNVQLSLINLAKVDGLPNDFNELVKNNQYNLGKIKIG